MNTGFARIHKFRTLEEAERAASTEVLSGKGMSIPCSAFQQGTRTMLSCSLSMADVQDFCVCETLEKRKKKVWSFDEAQESGQRPLDLSHARRIAEYIQRNVERPYILGSLTLNLSSDVNVYVVDMSPKQNQAQVMGYIVIPRYYTLLISDGQHRVVAIDMVLNRLTGELKQTFMTQGISATIVGETDGMQVRQDFADCGKVLQLPPSLLVSYDQRHPGNRIVSELFSLCPIFDYSRIDVTAKQKLPANSTKLFSVAQVKGFVKALATGSSTSGDEAFCKNIIAAFGEELEHTDYKLFREWTASFLNYLTTRLPAWGRAVKVPVGDTEAIPALRKEGWVCLSGTGLSALGAVAYTIYQEHQGDWKTYADRLAGLDWSRDAGHWQGSIISPSGTMLTSAVATRAAIGKIKALIGLAEAQEAAA